MNIVVDINHPAHVHYFKNFIWQMEKKGHKVLITATDREMARKLLEIYSFEYINMGNYGNSLIEKMINIPLMDIKLYRAVKTFHPDIFIGFGSIRAAHTARLMGKVCINLEDTEHTKWENSAYIPFTNAILTPKCFRSGLGKTKLDTMGTLNFCTFTQTISARIPQCSVKSD